MNDKTKTRLSKRLEIIKISDQIGLRRTELLYGVTKKTIISWKKKYQIEGEEGLSKINHNPLIKSKITDEQKASIKKLYNDNPKISCREIVQILNLNCTIKPVLKLRKEIVANKADTEKVPNWIFDSIKLPCIISGKSVYLLTAVEHQSGITLTCTTEENIPMNLTAFIEHVLLFLHKTEEPEVLQIVVNSGRFRVDGKSFLSNNSFQSSYTHVDFADASHHKSTRLPDFLKKLIRFIPAEFDNYQKLVQTIDDYFFSMNTGLLSLNQHITSFNYLSYKSQHITINFKRILKNQTVLEIFDKLIMLIDAEISTHNLSKADILLTYLIKINSSSDDNSELNIRIQLLLANFYIVRYDYKKAGYHSAKALTLARVLDSKQLILQAKIALSDYFLITTQYNKCKKILSMALALSQKNNKKKIECNILGKLGSLYKLTNDMHTKIFFDQQLAIALEIDDKEFYCEAMNNLSSFYLKAGDYKKALQSAQKSLNIAKKYEFHKAVFEANCNLAEYALSSNDFILAEEYSAANSKCKSNQQYNSLDVRNIIRQGFIKCRLNNNSDGVSFIEKGLSLAKLQNDLFLESFSYNNLGQICLFNKDFKKAVYYFKKAILINNKIGNNEQQIAVYGNLVICYNELKQAEKALAIARKKYEFVKLTRNKLQLALAVGAIGSCAFCAKKHKIALDNFLIQLKLLKGTNAELHKALALANVGLLYLDMQDHNNAKFFYKKAEKKILALNDNQNSSMYLSWIYLDLAIIAKTINNPRDLKRYATLAKEKATSTGDLDIIQRAEELLNS